MNIQEKYNNIIVLISSMDNVEDIYRTVTSHGSKMVNDIHIESLTENKSSVQYLIEQINYLSNASVSFDKGHNKRNAILRMGLILEHLKSIVMYITDKDDIDFLDFNVYVLM